MSSGTNSTTASVTTSETLYAQVVGCPGYFNSAIGSAAYTIASAPVTSLVLNAKAYATSISGLTSSLTAGATLVLWPVAYEGGFTTFNTPTGCSASWTPAGTSSSGSAQAVFIGTASASGTCTVAITQTGSPTAADIDLTMWQITNASTTVDGTGGVAQFINSSYEASAFNGPTVTTTVNGDILLAGLNGDNTIGMTVGSPWTQDAVCTNYNANAAHYLQATAGAIYPSWTPSAPANAYGMTIAIEP